jgi:hypothetical protein
MVSTWETTDDRRLDHLSGLSANLPQLSPPVLRIRLDLCFSCRHASCYVMGWFSAQDHAAGSWVWVELLGLALFAAFAALGLKYSLWFLAIGIAGHGVGWDSWHYENSAYIPNWYALACLLVDLALAAYVAAPVPAYREAWQTAKKN